MKLLVVTPAEHADYFRIRVLVGPLSGGHSTGIDEMLEHLASYIEDGDWSYDPERQLIDTRDGKIQITSSGEFVDLPAIQLDQSKQPH